MTKLIVKPPDPEAPGYTGKAYRIAKAAAELQANPGSSIAFVSIIDILAELSQTDDGTDAMAALQELTRDQLTEVLKELNTSSVPTPSAGS